MTLPGWQTVRCQGCGQERYAPVGQAVEQCPWCPARAEEKPVVDERQLTMWPREKR